MDNGMVLALYTVTYVVLAILSSTVGMFMSPFFANVVKVATQKA